MKTSFLKVTGIVLALALSLSTLSACSSPEEELTENPEVPTEITVTDQVGRTVTLESLPEKIVSLAPSNTEILFSLGLEDKIVGVSDYCDFPAAALEKPKIGGYSTTDVERIVAAEPDVIFASDMHVAEILPALEKLGQTVVVIDPRSLDEVLESFTLIGQVTGTEQKATEITAGMAARMKTITDKAAGLSEDQKPRVFYVMWHDPLMTVGGDTRICEMIEKAGGISLFNETEGYPMISLEALVDSNPQVIIAGTGMGEGADAPFTFALTEERLASSEARTNNRIYEVNTDLTGRPSERLIDGFEQLAKMMHPDLFE
jgi:iron complex transport system substrate-binding protein